jgi:predicted transcriptional regulator
MERGRPRKTTVDMLKKRLGYKTPEEVSKMLREQAQIKVKIMRSIQKEAKTVPEIAGETGLDKQTVFWYLMTYYKYGLVEEEGKTDEGYFKYKWKGGR